MIANGAVKMENILVVNAEEHNLKNITVSIPINAFTSITGVSGCGKSSLVYDTIYAESQRAFLESMSTTMYGQKLMNKPKVEYIENLPPALSVSQNYYNFNPRSTVGTITDISYFLRTLFALITNYDSHKKYSPNYFSSNNPQNYCKKCNGLGEEFVLAEELIIPDKKKPIKDGAILYFKGTKTSLEYKHLIARCEYYDIDISKSISELTKDEIFNLMHNEEKIILNLSFKSSKGKYRKKKIASQGFLFEMQKKLKNIHMPSNYINISKYLIKQPCSECKGTKLSDKVRKIKICKKSIADIENEKFINIPFWLEEVKKEYRKSNIYNQILQLTNQIIMRVKKLNELNVEYISANRSIPSLSGGEIQRIRLANQLTCPLKGLLYILDEPCKGLHYRNINDIIVATKSLIKKGNTVIAIEHNKQFISNSNKIIELGPQGGPKGGYIITEDKPANKFKTKPKFKKEKKFTNFFELKDICFRNIKHQNVKIPVKAITCITGVSGSGKSSLVEVISSCYNSNGLKFCKSFKGSSEIKKISDVNQKPIGKTPRSTIVSYLEIYEPIRNIFSQTKIAKKNNLTASSFSMNLEGGRCQTCQGTGLQKLEFEYLPTSFILCPECDGKRFHKDILKITYNGKNISEILDSSIDEIIDIFKNNDEIYQKLTCMIDIGLGYLHLGQMSMNLSGGESQRIKLARALGKNTNDKRLYILDEPTSGLHSSDSDKIANFLLKLVDCGHTIIIIEHNIEFIAKVADYMIDFGIYGGDKGGNIKAFGIPEEVVNNTESSWNGFSYTYLKKAKKISR